MAKSEIHYRYTDSGITVSKPNKWRLDFKNAKAAKHVGEDIIIYSSTNQQIRVDKYGSRHFHY